MPAFSNTLSTRWVLVVCILLCGVRLLWPGDVPFIQDEPELIRRAYEQNERKEWTTHGLRGTRSFDYGPLPIVFYRGLLKVSRSPLSWVILKTTVVSLLTLLCVFWLLRLEPWLDPKVALVPFLSPYLWFYARDLWDNSLNVPLSALTFVAALSFLKKPGRAMFSLAALSGVAALLVHLMVLPLVLGVAVAMGWFQSPWLRKHWAWVAGTLLVGLAVSSGYLGHLLSMEGGSSSRGFRAASFFFSLYGARFFSAMALEYFFGWWWFLAGVPLSVQALGIAAVAVSLFAFVPTFWGGFRLFQKWRKNADPLTVLTGAAFAFHVLVLTANQLVSHPHYYNSSWFLFFVLFAIGMTELGKRAVWGRLSVLYYFGLGVTLVFSVAHIHSRGGNRELHYGATLSNQLAVASQLSCYPKTVPLSDSRTYSNLAAMEVLRSITPCTGSEKTAKDLNIAYIEPLNPLNGVVFLEVKN
jgi:hypothetical protein